MRLFVERGVRNLFYAIIGLSMVLVTTPGLAGAFPASGAVFLWPLTGLLAYFLHLFEDTGKLASPLRVARAADRRARVSRRGMPCIIAAAPPPAGAEGA